jgi:hypothetical protein
MTAYMVGTDKDTGEVISKRGPRSLEGDKIPGPGRGGYPTPGAGAKLDLELLRGDDVALCVAIQDFVQHQMKSRSLNSAVHAVGFLDVAVAFVKGKRFRF